MAQLVWHYTIGDRFKLIAESGVILPATANVPAGEKPCVWFSRNQTWDETATKARLDQRTGKLTRATREEMHERGGGLVRIGVRSSVAPHTWTDYKRLSGVTEQHARNLYDSGVNVGAKPSEWRCCFGPVPREKWAAVEVWHEGNWTNVPFEKGAT